MEHFMSRFGTRRNFFERINMALTGFVFTRALPFQEAAATRQPLTGAVDYYDKLGVTKTINAAGTYTYLTGSTIALRSGNGHSGCGFRNNSGYGGVHDGGKRIYGEPCHAYRHDWLQE